MPSSHIIGNRNSTPEASKSSLRPPSSRTIGAGHHLRASADMGGAFPPTASASPLSPRNIRPASEVYLSQHQSQAQSSTEDAVDEAAKQWLAEVNQYESTLEEMAAATMDQDFKDELSAIEQWFKVLSEAERTSALYALLQQTTHVQIRFFIQVLQQMAKNHPMSGVLSPANFGERDAMSNRLSDAMSKLAGVEGPRNSMNARPPPSPGAKRNSGLDFNTINAMFPDAAAVIAQKKADYAQQTANVSSGHGVASQAEKRSSMIAPTISAPQQENGDNLSHSTSSIWNQREGEGQSRPKSSSSGQPPMGQFTQPPPSAGLRPPPLQLGGNSNIQNTTVSAPENKMPELPPFSPYAQGSSWASLVSTPMNAVFSNQATQVQADMVANATAMKLAALSTVNNRIALDDVRKYRRSRSKDNLPNNGQPLMSPANASFVVTGDNGQSQVLTAQQIAAIQAQQAAVLGSHRSRPNSPGLMVPGANLATLGLASPQNNGFLTAFDGSPGLVSLNPLGMAHGHPGSHEGYLSDHSEIHTRGRSPRGRRGTSKPPENPCDPELLKDIPAWLRSLRLHKYTDNLKDLEWKQLIELDDKALEARGVNALGARRKMLKVFDQVKDAKAEGKIPLE